MKGSKKAGRRERHRDIHRETERYLCREDRQPHPALTTSGCYRAGMCGLKRPLVAHSAAWPGKAGEALGAEDEGLPHFLHYHLPG